MDTRQENALVFGKSRAFARVIETADRYAPCDWPVLVLGETGVGKELVARRIHERSGRPLSRFFPVNCAALPPALFESELFGHERGAFSGAVTSSPGLLRHARGGTVFLDEIGELDLVLQAKLLRFLDSGEVRSVGSNRVDTVEVRIVAATNVDLFAAARRRAFRPDLLERLAVLTIPVPPLRERPEDITAIAERWCENLGAEADPEALATLGDYGWPGNVRQLRNLIVRASVRAEGRIPRELVARLLLEEQARDARLPLDGSEGGEDLLQGSLAEIERQVIVAKLRQCQGNRKRTAKELGIAKSTLHEKLRRWKGEPEPTAPCPVPAASHWDGARLGL